MLLFEEKITNKYAVELDLLRKIRNFRDGITIVEYKMGFDFFKADHNPKFEISLIFANIKIFEFLIYNVDHHAD